MPRSDKVTIIIRVLILNNNIILNGIFSITWQREKATERERE